MGAKGGVALSGDLFRTPVSYLRGNSLRKQLPTGTYWKTTGKRQRSKTESKF